MYVGIVIRVPMAYFRFQIFFTRPYNDSVQIVITYEWSTPQSWDSRDAGCLEKEDEWTEKICSNPKYKVFDVLEEC